MSEKSLQPNAPCLAFLIPFAPRRAKAKWDIACAQLHQTLKSIHNSTNGNFVVVVAGHEPPDFDMGFDARFKFISLNHPISVEKGRLVGARLDKTSKYAAAWDYARLTWKPSYVMKLDADDLVSARLVDWLATFGGEAGYLISHGFMWKSGARYLIHKVEHLDRLCGSCLIIRSDYVDKSGPFLTDMDGMPLDEAALKFAAEDRHSLVPGSGTTTLLLNNCHQRYAAQFAHLGHILSSIPFHAVVYRVNNPDSVSSEIKTLEKQTLRQFVGRIRRTRLITSHLRREFMLE